MLRGTLEYAFPPECIDKLFRRHAVQQYEDALLFSTVVEVLGLAVTGTRKSVNAAYLASKEQVQRTIQRELGLAALPEPPDVADALAAALCHCYAQRRPA